MYYVYIHRRKTDEKIFYIGKGRDDRAWSITGRSHEWLRQAVEHGRTVTILAENLSEKQALVLESMMIRILSKEENILTNVYSGAVGKKSDLGVRARINKVTPPLYYNGIVPFYRWYRSKHGKSVIKSVAEMVAKYGGIHDEWNDVIEGYSEKTKSGWKLIIKRSKRD